ncbi:hypothetical protein PVK06_004876 [Gossypium arboreum]|uniref:Reverse transcriptase n=1 Tax=Gossypium arboreum TaxID=29729 RepID=A0ABR0QU29_GOSAR|nr:hypothetical protein PVK06_004876 [Gossypium arboreum]
MIHENILIAHELMHYPQSVKNGQSEGFVIKLDMSKAYDCIEWNPLKDVMKRLGFLKPWVEKIMSCVCLVRYVNFKKDCPRCGAKEETFIHALKDCPMACTILTLEGFDNRLLVACKKWEKPPYGYAKIKFDASVSYGKVSFFVIVRDSDGFMLGGSGGFKDKIMTIECAKLVAFEESLKVASAINISKACLNLIVQV